MKHGTFGTLAYLLGSLTVSFHSSACKSDVLTHHHAYTIVKLPQCMHIIASFLPPLQSQNVLGEEGGRLGCVVRVCRMFLDRMF